MRVACVVFAGAISTTISVSNSDIRSGKCSAPVCKAKDVVLLQANLNFNSRVFKRGQHHLATANQASGTLSMKAGSKPEKLSGVNGTEVDSKPKGEKEDSRQRRNHRSGQRKLGENVGNESKHERHGKDKGTYKGGEANHGHGAKSRMGKKGDKSIEGIFGREAVNKSQHWTHQHGTGMGMHDGNEVNHSHGKESGRGKKGDDGMKRKFGKKAVNQSKHWTHEHGKGVDMHNGSEVDHSHGKESGLGKKGDNDIKRKFGKKAGNNKRHGKHAKGMKIHKIHGKGKKNTIKPENQDDSLGYS